MASAPGAAGGLRARTRIARSETAGLDEAHNEGDQAELDSDGTGLGAGRDGRPEPPVLGQPRRMTVEKAKVELRARAARLSWLAIALALALATMAAQSPLY